MKSILPGVKYKKRELKKTSVKYKKKFDTK